jgi:3-dehydroquinate synthase
VALGCVLAFDFSHRRGLCTASDAQRVREHLRSVELPTTLAQLGLAGRGKELARHMEQDKKRTGGRTAFILVRGIGAAFVDDGVDLADVSIFLNETQ